MQDRIAVARRNLTAAEAQADWGQAAASRAEIVRLHASQEPESAEITSDGDAAGDESTPTRSKRTAKEN